MSNQTTARERSVFVRQHHRQNGGEYSTRQLASMLGVSEHTIRLYIRNEVCQDPNYTPPRKVTAKAIRFLLSHGIDKATIASLYGVTKRLVDMKLSNDRENEQCPA